MIGAGGQGESFDRRASMDQGFTRTMSNINTPRTGLPPIGSKKELRIDEGTKFTNNSGAKPDSPEGMNKLDSSNLMSAGLGGRKYERTMSMIGWKTSSAIDINEMVPTTIFHEPDPEVFKAEVQEFKKLYKYPDEETPGASEEKQRFADDPVRYYKNKGAKYERKYGQFIKKDTDARMDELIHELLVRKNAFTKNVMRFARLDGHKKR
jgi:hypothetical protein